MTLYPEDIVRLLISMALGGLIGSERELRDKAAGFRTLMFICAGSALFTIFSARLAQAGGADPTRIAAQIVTGIGFLGAGVILRERGEIHGLTTAATIWLTAALGAGVGGGQILFSTLATAIILLALFVFPAFEGLMNRIRQVRTYQVTTPASQDKYSALCSLLRAHRMRIISEHRARHGESMICTWRVSGPEKEHEELVRELFEDSEITEFEV